MALTTMAQVLTALPGQQLDVLKSGLAGVAGQFTSGWLLGGQPVAGSAPSSGLAGDIPTKATTGAISFVNPAGGNGLYFARSVASLVTASLTSGGALYLYDRLWHNSGIDATSTSAQTINSATLTRPDALGNGAELWWQVYALMGAGTPTVTATYTNPAGTGSRSGSSGVLPTTMAAGRTGPFTLNSGDEGVKSVQTWQASATFTSGTIGLVIRRQVAMLTTRVDARSTIEDALEAAMTSVPSDACLELLWLVSDTATRGAIAELHLVEG